MKLRRAIFSGDYSHINKRPIRKHAPDETHTLVGISRGVDGNDERSSGAGGHGERSSQSSSESSSEDNEVGYGEHLRIIG
jgi:hypothetical protein